MSHVHLIMSYLWNLMGRLGKDETGAALIEYTALLAILLVAVLVLIGAIGGWILNTWTNLNTNLNAP
jgi:pilus assembly protein Flp/PilA